jgi:hypothetical protein
MRGRTQRALALLLVGLLLGVGGEIVRLWVPGRLDLVLWIGATMLGAAALVSNGALTALPQTRWLAAAACLTIPCLLWRDSPVLFGLNIFWLGVLLATAAAGAEIRALDRIPVSAMLRGGFGVLFAIVLGPLPVLASDIQWSELPVAGRARGAAAVGVGIAAAVPVLVVFGVLLGSADPLFAETMTRTF